VLRVRDRAAAAAVALAIALIALVALAGCSDSTSDDASEEGADESSGTEAYMEEAAASDEEILTAEIVQTVCEVPDAQQSEFDLNDDADYQTAFDSDELGRLAIMTILPGADTYDEVTAGIEGGITLEGIGDAAMSAENTVIFTSGGRTVLISTLENVYPAGQRPALTGDQLEELARVAAARM
jgi:hypothetical protein